MLSHISHPIRLLSLAICLVSAPCFAQQGGQGGGGTGGTGDLATDAALSGTSGNTGGAAEANAFNTLDADMAFSAIDRSDTAGSNVATVGREEDAAGARATTGGLGGLGGLGGGGFGGLGGLGNLFGFGNAGGAQNNQRPIRTRLRSAINVPPTPTAVVQRNAMSRFTSLPSTPALRGVNVVMRDRTAILTGVVKTKSDRRMSELLMRLEPGVKAVENQITVVE